jgi:hypothetical protein
MYCTYREKKIRQKGSSRPKYWRNIGEGKYLSLLGGGGGGGGGGLSWFSSKNSAVSYCTATSHGSDYAAISHMYVIYVKQ